MKRICILSLVLGSLFISGCSCSKPDEPNNNNQDDNVTDITDENVIGEKNIDGISLENTTFQVQNGTTTIVTKVTNKTGAEFVLENYQMIITDKDGVVLSILTSTVNETLAVDEEKSIATPFEFDLSDATDVEYKVNVSISE